MIRKIALAAILALAACGQPNSDAGVMAELAKADAADRARDVHEAPQTLPSGLVLQFTRRSADQALPQPTARAAVLVHYEGKLADGSVFDSSFARREPAQFPLAGVVPGFAEAIEHMRPGDELTATLPPALGYGAGGQPPVIPPNATLRFRIVLLAFQEPGGEIVRAPH